MASPVDDKGRALRGSACQMQLYVNAPARRRQLDAVVLEALPTLAQAGGVALSWRSPLARPLLSSDRPFHEYRDGKVLDSIGRCELRAEWAKYWPARAPRWDAIAVAQAVDGSALGPVLVEAKSYPGEFWPTSGGTRAEGDRLDTIRRRLQETRDWLHVDTTPEVEKLWLGALYQSANRLATLCFFRRWLNPGVPAWLLHLFFLEDPTHLDPRLATSKETWDQEITKAEAALGLSGLDVEHAAHAYLSGGTYEDLVAATGG